MKLPFPTALQMFSGSDYILRRLPSFELFDTTERFILWEMVRAHELALVADSVAVALAAEVCLVKTRKRRRTIQKVRRIEYIPKLSNDNETTMLKPFRRGSI